MDKIIYLNRWRRLAAQFAAILNRIGPRFGLAAIVKRWQRVVSHSVVEFGLAIVGNVVTALHGKEKERNRWSDGTERG
jgi:hypothetical protein